MPPVPRNSCWSMVATAVASDFLSGKMLISARRQRHVQVTHGPNASSRSIVFSGGDDQRTVGAPDHPVMWMSWSKFDSMGLPLRCALMNLIPVFLVTTVL